MPLLVKICGLKTPDALDAALDAGADMVGFVFFAPSPRNVSLHTARELGERVKGRAEKGRIQPLIIRAAKPSALPAARKPISPAKARW